MAHQFSRQLVIDSLKSRLVLICLFDAAKRQRQGLLVVEVKKQASAAAHDPLVGVVAHFDITPDEDD